MSANILYYWERQGTEHTCGIHTLNCILQGPYISKSKFEQKAKELLEEQKLISPELDENIIDEQGCSLELLHKCLTEYEIDCKHLKFDGNLDFPKVKGLIVNNGDHFFLLMNYSQFWMNFDSLSEHGPEFLNYDELAMLLSYQLCNEGSFIQIFGDLPRTYCQEQSLQGHQRVFTLNEILENGQLIKAIRLSQKPPEKKQLSYEEQIKRATQLSMEHGKSAEVFLSEEEQIRILEEESMKGENKPVYEVAESDLDELVVLELAKKMSIEENLEYFKQCSKKVRICRENKFSWEEYDERDSIKDFLEKLNEKMGFSEIELYIKNQGLWIYPNKALSLDKFLESAEGKILYLKGLI